jgi:hypothetical protein
LLRFALSQEAICEYNAPGVAVLPLLVVLSDDERLPMKLTLIALSALLLGFIAHSLQGAEPDRAPFQSVVRAGDAIVAKLPATGIRWIVNPGPSGASSGRITEYNEAFRLAAGSTLTLVEKHSRYVFTAQLTPTAGLHVEQSFDPRSPRGESIKKQYFIRAK